MPRLASLYLPDLPIERIRRAAKNAERPKSSPSLLGEGDHAQHGGGAFSESELPLHHAATLRDPPPRASSGRIGEEKEGRPACSVPRGPGFRPGARWAREEGPGEISPTVAPGAMVTAQRLGQKIVVAAACPQARALGLAPGMALTQARILVPGLDVRDAEPEADAAFLARLGLFAARRWTPRAAVSGPDGLWLDLSGVAHLFGGEERMARRMLAFCARLGFTARIAIAGTLGAAHALARFGGARLVLCPSGGEAEALAPLPLAALRLDEDALAAARRLGVETVGAAMAMPRAPLQRRFGSALLSRLDQALGRAGEPFEPIVPEDPPQVLLRFMEPIATAEAIEEAMAEGLRRLIRDLERAGLAARSLTFIGERIDGAFEIVRIGTARATRDPVHLLRLLKARIETIDPGFGIERIRLVADRVEPLGPQPVAGILAGEPAEPDLVPLIDQLAGRLGALRLFRMSAVESDVPERSVARIGPLACPQSWPDWPRPVRLLSPPERIDNVVALLPDLPPRRFTWRGRPYRVRQADGPERIHGEWWKRAAEAEAVRDYFQVEDEAGHRFWLFRRGDGEDPRTGDLSWYLHGVFA